MRCPGVNGVHADLLRARCWNAAPRPSNAAGLDCRSARPGLRWTGGCAARAAHLLVSFPGRRGHSLGNVMTPTRTAIRLLLACALVVLTAGCASTPDEPPVASAPDTADNEEATPSETTADASAGSEVERASAEEPAATDDPTTDVTRQPRPAPSADPPVARSDPGPDAKEARRDRHGGHGHRRHGGHHDCGPGGGGRRRRDLRRLRRDDGRPSDRRGRQRPDATSVRTQPRRGDGTRARARAGRGGGRQTPSSRRSKRSSGARKNS